VRVSLLLGGKSLNKESASTGAIAAPLIIDASSVEDAFDKALANGLRSGSSAE